MQAALTVKIVNPEGLHARPCHAIVSLALEYECSLSVQCGETVADGRSILSLMTLQACQGSQLGFKASGEGAEELVDRLRALVSGGF